VVQHADTVNVVKTLWSEGQMENIRLKDGSFFVIPQVSRRYLGCGTQIDPHYAGPSAANNISKPARSASHIQHSFSGHFPKRKSGFLLKRKF
jgi:hypothetical protein